ncbi:unnamed protein product, partial [Closterium sp. NIES-54]
YSAGCDPATAALKPAGKNSIFRFASVNYNAETRKWGLATSANWTNYRTSTLGRVRNQGSCGSSWAMAAVTAVELAYAVSRNASDYSQAPRYLSTQQVLSCGDSKKGNCTGGWPTTALDYVVKTTGKYGGMVTEGNYPYTGNTSCTYGTKDDDDSGGNKKKPSSCDTSKFSCARVRACIRAAQVKKKATAIGIRSYESIDYYGWLGLILAVQGNRCGLVAALFGVTSLASRHPTPGPPDCSAWDPQSRPSNPSATPLPSPYPPLPSQQGNRCGPVAALFGITIARLKALNPGLTCPKGAYPGQQVCRVWCSVSAVRCSAVQGRAPIHHLASQGAQPKPHLPYWGVPGPAGACRQPRPGFVNTAWLSAVQCHAEQRSDMQKSKWQCSAEHSCLYPWWPDPYTHPPLHPPPLAPCPLSPPLQICVQEGSGLAIPLCAQYHVIASPDTCVSIRQQYGLSWSTYFALNPGVFCANLYPAATVDGVNAIPSGAQVGCEGAGCI